MVRETRHLWVGNLPENIREDRIREHFKRYGRVQSVKLLPRGEECPVDGGSSGSLGESNEGGSGSGSAGGGGGGGGSSTSSGGASATVAFMDIKSAAKAHATEHTLDERALTTQYYEPQHLQHRFPSHGSSEDHGSGGGSGGGGGGTGNVSGGSGGGGGGGNTGTGVGGSGAGSGERERGGEGFESRGFYSSERSNRVGTGSGSGVGVGVVGSGGGSGGGVVVGGHPTDPSTGDPVGGYIPRGRPPPASSYHVTSSRARDRLYSRTSPYVSDRPPPPPHLDRHRGSLPPSSWSAYESTSSRYGNAPPPPSPATNDAYQDEQGGGGGGGSGSSGALRQHKKQRRKSRSGSSSPSGSSRSGSSSSSRSGSSGGSTTGGSTSPGSSPHRTSNVAVTEDRRALAICVRNLPTRSSDTSLKDGLFHEYKKHGKVTWVKVVGVAGDRYALVCFKKPEDVEKALEVSHDKLFFGCKIEVAPYQGYDVEDNEFRPYEAELDEYHPKATRTLFIGNLEKDVTSSELRKHFEPFGEIIEIDIKKQGAVSSYAFCQYADIGSVVKAMRSMDGEHLGTNRIKLGFGKSMPTSCVWVDGIGDCMSEKYLNMQFHQFGPITQVVVDRERGQALVFFDQISCAQAAVKEMRGVVLRGRRLQVDFASRECQETFYEHLERQGNTSEKPWDSRPSPASSFDVTIPSRRERGSFDSAVTVSSSCSRFTRYDTPPRSRTASYSRTSGGSTPGASPAHPTAMSRSSRRSYQDSYYDGDYGEPTSRRFRSYDEFSQGSGASHDDYQSSVLSDGKLNDDDCPPPSRRHAVQSVVTSVDPPAPPPPLLPPPDIRHLQKERVHLLEQLEECHSSGDEVGFAPKKRTKLDSSSSTILCEDDEPEIASLLVTSHSSRKGMDYRRVSDSKVVVHHSTRRSSCEGRGPGPCKRRRDATSRHHEHHDGSRPGTPLVDERPENLVPSEPRRFRERSHDGPLSLPLPRFAAQMLNNNNNNTSSSNNNNGSGTRSSGASLAKVASPPCTSFTAAPSPRAAPQPPASPPPRHPSSSPTSSDSETAPQSPSLEERIRSLDEKYEKWSGSRALSAVGGDGAAKLDVEKFKFRHKLLDMAFHEVQPSDILKSVMAKRSVFDEDSKRLENYSEKYEPREFTGIIGIGSVSMIGSTAGLTTSTNCTSKVCLQYPFPSHPPVQLSSGGTSITNMVGVNTSLSTSLTPTTTTMVTSAMKTDPRIAQHNCIHPTPATPITPGTSIKTVSPELPPVSLPIGLGSGTVAGSANSSLLSSNGSVGNIHNLGASTHRGLSISGSTASPTTSATTSTSSTDAFATVITTTAVPVTTSSTVTSSAATTTTSVIGTTPSTTTTSSIAPPSSITSSSNSSSSSSLSTSSTDLPRSRLRKESSASSRESRDSRDGKDSRESKHGKGKDCQRRSRKEEADVERSRKDRDERESSSVVNDIGESDNHSKDFKDNKELRYERKEREEKERRDKEDRDKQDRRDKEDRDRQERKEREEREKREKDEERRERERLDKERQEKDRREREERERERKEREENELKEKERREKERIDRERREREEKERQERREREERERRERERKEREEREERERKEFEKIRLEREKQEKERLRREREEQERREKEERDRLERERRREEKERLERERKREREEKERIERERRKEKEEREKMEKEKREKEERERLEREKHEREKRKEREDQERRDKEKAEREKRRDREEKDKDKRERDDSRRQLQQPTENHVHPSSVTSQSQNQITPAPVSMKRRCSSQDGPTEEDAKRMKISDHRRDSKDRSRQNRRSEDRKHRNDSHRSSRESRESRDSKDSGCATQQDNRDGAGHNESTRESNSRDNTKEKQKVKRNRSEKESRERSPRVSHEPEKEFLSRLELTKNVDSSSTNEQASLGTNHARDSQHHQQQQSALNLHSDGDDGPLSTHEIQVARHPSATDTDSDEPKKHSIFDIVDDEPAYISMYDKVKARSTKNMQKLEEEKRQVRLKDKFSQLKQSRARREEKKQSTSWDGDSVSSKALTEDEATSESDSTRTKSLSRKGSRSRIHSDTSEEEEPFNNKVRKAVVKSERFLESDVDLGFADTEEKQNRLEVSSVIVNSVHATIKEEPRTSDEDEKISIGFRRNHPIIEVINHERDSRKKSHKKKQKRQKNSISHENSVKIEPPDNTEHKSKTNVVATPAECRPNHSTEPAAITTSTTTIVATALDNSEERLRADKKQRSKKDKRRDRNGEDKAKARRKRLNRQEARDSQRMEDIFGPLSDDVDDGPSNTFFNRFGNMTSENSVYASDSDGGRSSLDMDRVRRKTEKKRRHQPEDENSVDLTEAGREIEAKLLGMPSSPKAAVACNEPNDHDVFRFTDDNDSIEPSTPSTAPEKIKEKKKKRKRSKEERSRKDYHHHHHHHHHHHEKSGELPYLGAEPSPPRASSPLISKTVSPTLPAPRDALLSPIPKTTSSVTTVSSITPPVVSGAQTPKLEKKKEKLIPGFGIEIDETIHENAVKSISEPDERENSQSRSGREEAEVSVPPTPPTQNEDKPRVAISQEETEDAVAALLEETFGASTEDFSYEGEEEEAEADGVAGAPAEAPQEDVEEMQQAVESLNASTGEGDADLKPDTPQSEHDLQIDTDTDQEDPNYETFDLTQPPKTPDIPSFYKSPAKTLNMTPVLTVPEKPIEMRIPPAAAAKPQSPPPSSVIAHSWNLNEHKPREPVRAVQVETTAAESAADAVASPERVSQADQESSLLPPSQYKQPMLGPCSVPVTSEVPKISATSPRPSPVTVQPLYQRLPVSPQSQMVPSMRQASPKTQNVATVSSSSTTNTTTPLPQLGLSRIPPLVPSQLSPRVSQPLSPNGQWSRNPTLSPHVPNVSKPSPPTNRIAVCVPISAQRLETPVQHIYSTAATQQPVIQHASGMLAPASGYPRGGLPPLTLNIPSRPFMPVSPLAPGMQVKSSRDSSLSSKSVIETLLPVNPNEPQQRLEEPKLSPAVIPESTNKASTSPKVPSPNQPPTYIPETAKIEINASTSSPVFGKPACVTDTYMMSSRTQKQIPVSITTDSNLLSPRQKQELSNLQLLTTHVPRSSTPSPVIVAHGQSHLCHKPVHTLGPPAVSSPNQPLIKTVVPIVSQQIAPSAPNTPVSSEKCGISQTPLPPPCSRQPPVSQSQLPAKSHVSLVSTVSQTIIARVVPPISTVSTPMNEQTTPECLEPRVTQAQQLELDPEAQVGQTAQPMQLTPPVQSTQPIDEIKQEPADVKEEDTIDETKYNVEFEKPLNQPCAEDNVKQEKQEIKTEVAPCVPKVEVPDTIAPKLEPQVPIKTEPAAAEIKEEDSAKENDDVELDEESVEDSLKEPNTDPLAIDSKEDATDSKEDSDYWSAKEVNIESVIKKVDALCDGEGNDADDGAQPTENANSDSHDTSKNESDWFDSETTESESKKGFASTDDHDEGVETCENESTRSRRGRTKSRRGCRGGVTTRRGGRNAAAAVSHRRGGRSPRGSKHHVEKNKLPADVYEFHDDSEEDNAGRPRLILTIKSPGPNVTGPNAQPATPVAAVKEVPPEEFVSPAANTRKSRRLAERDGSRNTVDDVIEDVVRGSPVNKGLAGAAIGNVHATRRSTRHNNSPRNVQTVQQPVIPLTELRKSPRGGGRKATRRTSENNDDSGEEKSKEPAPATATTVVTAAAPREEAPIKEEPKLVEPESPKAEEPAPPVAPTPPQKRVSLEPMTLIDPVTGDLIPMRESEEGQYIPVSTTSGQAQTTNRAQCEPRNSNTVTANPTTEAPRAKAAPSENALLVPPTEPKKEVVIEHAPPCQPTATPVPQQIHQIQQQVQPQTSVITKPQSPTVQVTSTITVAPSPTTVTTTINTVVTAPTITTAQTVLTCSSQAKPTSFKAHMLNANKLVTQHQQQVVVTKPIAPIVPSQTIMQNIVKPPAQAIQQGLNLQIPPSRVVSPSLSPRAKQAAQLAAANGSKQGQPMSPVLNNTGAPPNPKQHLLQAAKQQTSTIVNMPQKLPLHSVSVNLVNPAPRIHQPVSQATALKGINGQPHLNPKTHLLQAVVPMVPGTVASSVTQPHLVNPQSISGGRLTGTPKPTGTMEPQKMDVAMPGCIMVPTASAQPRSVPMSPYEAPLHGSAGATPPGSQYSLVPPHRSQSPPLPPPAHHHTNASQGDVVNHYGLTRGGELAPHYMFQYQYLREPLPTPRIAYHIPGTRSPHLPLDPKLEGGIDDSHSPPLELRRATRTPQERTTDSPQVAQVYMLPGGMRLQPPPQYNTGNNPSLPPAGARTTYYDPPPAHIRSQYPMTASEAPTDRAITPDRSRKHQVVTPPHASQVPPQADSFQMLLQRYPVMWQGLLALKNDQAAVQMHFVFGNPNVARDSLPCNSDGSTPPLRIAQRMRLEQTQVEGVARKMQTDNEHCMLLALPCGRDEVDVLQQSKNLQTGFIMYLQQKQAAGIVNIAAPGSQQPAYVVHIFPSCDFANENLARIAPDLLHRVAKIAHLLIVIATV